LFQIARIDHQHAAGLSAVAPGEAIAGKPCGNVKKSTRWIPQEWPSISNITAAHQDTGAEPVIRVHGAAPRNRIERDASGHAIS
jgi:hypothetical protein